MRILSFDCANRSLAVCLLDINTGIVGQLYDGIKQFDINTMMDITDDYIKIHIFNVYDLTNGKNTDTVMKASLLKKCLGTLDDIISSINGVDQVLIEYQMPSNDKSRCVSQQILYHYVDKAPVCIVGPTLKNKVVFSTLDKLSHGFFISKYASNYTANKNHTKANLLYWLDIFDKTHLLDNIKKKNIDDISDAFMQIFGWLSFGKHCAMV